MLYNLCPESNATFFFWFSYWPQCACAGKNLLWGFSAINVQKRICLQAVFRDFFSTVVSQFYVTEAENEYVIRGNAAVMKCKIPSFVADFVFVEAWIGEDGTTHMYNNGYDSYGKCAREL